MADVKVTVLKNGPYKVEGAIDVVQEGVTAGQGGPVFLCRCGASAKKPYCDGAHSRTGFKDDPVSPA